MATVGTLLFQVRAESTALQQDMRKATRHVQQVSKEAQQLDQSMRQVERSMNGAADATRKQDSALVSGAATVGKFVAAHLAADAALKAFRAATASSTQELTALQAASAAVRGELAKIGGVLASVTGGLSRFTGGIKTAAKMVVGRFLPGLTLLAGAAGLAGLTKALTEFGAAASGITPVTNAFDRLAEHVGTTGDALRTDLKQAVRGTVSDFDLMKSSVIALNSEVIQSPELLAELARHARVLGRTVDQDTTEALDNMIRGIGLMNPQLLKSLGVLVSVDEATRRWAEANDRSVASMTDHEKHAAFLEVALDEIREASGRVGDETDDLATTLARSEAASEDFSNQMRTAVAEAEGIKRANENWATIRLILNELRRDTVPGLAGEIASLVGHLESALVSGPLERFFSGDMLDAGSFKAFKEEMQQIADAMERARDVSDEVDTTVTGPASLSFPEGFGQRGDIPAVAELRQRAKEAFLAALDEARAFNAAMEEALGDGFDELQANIDDTRSTIEDLVRFGFSPASDAVRELAAEIERLQDLQAFERGVAQFGDNLRGITAGLGGQLAVRTPAIPAEPIQDVTREFDNLAGVSITLGDRFQALADNFGGGIGGTIKGLFDPTRIGSQVVGNLLTPVIGSALSAITDPVSDFFGDLFGSNSEAVRLDEERNQLLRQNNRTLEELRDISGNLAGGDFLAAGRALRGLPGGGLVGARGLSEDALQQRNEAQRIIGSIRELLAGEEIKAGMRASLQEFLEPFGLSVDEFVAAVRESGIELFGPSGGLLPSAVDDAVEALEILGEGAKEVAQEAAEAAQRIRFQVANDLRDRALRLTGQGNRAAMASLRFNQAIERQDFQGSPAMRELLTAVHELEVLDLEMNQAIAEVNRNAEAQLEALDGQADLAREQLDVSRDQLREQERLVNETRQVVISLTEFADQLLLGPRTILSPTQQLREARDQFGAMRALAMGGDVSAAESLPEAARALLDASRAVNASNEGFVADFRVVQETVESVRDQFAGQLTVEEQILAELQSQTGQLQDQISQLQSQRAAIQSSAQEQIDRIRAQFDEEREFYRQLIDLLEQQLPFLEDIANSATDTDPPTGDDFVVADSVTGGGGASAQVVSELREANAELRAQLATLQAGFNRMLEGQERQTAAVEDNTRETRSIAEAVGTIQTREFV